MARIVSLKAQNVKRLQAVEITPDGNTVVVGGDNGSGKSSLLDSIAYAIQGKGALPEQPIRNGQSKAQIIVDLGDIIVERVITTKGTTLKVKNKEGEVQTSPQSILDKMRGRLTFDPLEFSRMKPAAQMDILKELAGLDFAEADRKRAENYEKRRDVNRELDVEQLKRNLLKKHEGVGPNPVDIAGLTAKLQAAQATNEDNANARRRMDGEDCAVRSRAAELVELAAEMEKLKEAHDKAVKRLHETQAVVKDLQDVDTAPILHRMETAGEFNRKVHENAERDKLTDLCADLRKRSEVFTKELMEIDAWKSSAVRNADYPIDGLGINDTCVTFGGVPLEQCSSSEQLRISVAMGLALNPKLRVLLIRDGSLLDKDSLKLISDMAEEADAQIWIERVSTGEEVHIVMQDGLVQEERG